MSFRSFLRKLNSIPVSTLLDDLVKRGFELSIAPGGNGTANVMLLHGSEITYTVNAASAGLGIVMAHKKVFGDTEITGAVKRLDPSKVQKRGRA